MPKTFYQITKKGKKIREEIKNKPIIIIKYKNKMKTYCVKCKKDTENIHQEQLEQKITDYLCTQNVVIVETNKKQRVY